MQAKILIDLPDVRQSFGYDCGPACLRSIATYYGVGTGKEDDFIQACRAKPDGAHPRDIVKAAKALGLKAEFHDHYTAGKLRNRIKEGKPVICEIQAWGNAVKYFRLEDGHYVVAIGYDDDNIFFEDPSLKGVRGFLTYEEMEERWQELEENGDQWFHSVIVVWNESHPKQEQVLNKVKHID